MARFPVRMLCMALGLLLLAPAALAQPLEEGTPMTLTAPSAILVEAETGTVIFEKNADERRPAASVTKLMTPCLTRYLNCFFQASMISS